MNSNIIVPNQFSFLDGRMRVCVYARTIFQTLTNALREIKVADSHNSQGWLKRFQALLEIL